MMSQNKNIPKDIRLKLVDLIDYYYSNIISCINNKNTEYARQILHHLQIISLIPSYPLTIFFSSPRKNALIFSATTLTHLWRASEVAHAVCGVMISFVLS